MNHYVYLIVNNINNKKYIGKRSCSCPIEQDNFTKHILLVCDSEEQAYIEEEKAIELAGAVESDRYYNLVYGGISGNLGISVSEETRKKMSIVNSGANNSKAKAIVCLNTMEEFDYMRLASIKYNISESDLSECCKGNFKSAGTINGVRCAWVYKKDLDKLTKDEISKKIEDAINSKKGENNGKSRKVICLNTLEIFNTITLAREKYNIKKKKWYIGSL